MAYYRRRTTGYSRRPMRTRRAPYRRPARRRRRGVSRKLALRANLVNWKVKTVFDAVVDSAGQIKLGFNYNGLPDAVDTSQAVILSVNTAGTGVMARAFTETLGATLLSQMRCAGILVQFQPNFPNGSLQTTNGYQPVVIMHDRDGIETNFAGTTFASLQSQVHGIKIKNLYRPWRMYHKAIRYPLYNKYPGSSSTTNTANQNLWGQWHAVNSAIGDLDNAYGCQTMIIGRPLDITEFPAGTVVGTFIVTAYLQYKDRA